MNMFTGVIVLTALANRFRLHKLNKVEKFVMSYGGLRGAVAFALVLLIDPKHVKLQPMFVTTTIAVIYFTVFIQVRTSLRQNRSDRCSPKLSSLPRTGQFFFVIKFISRF